MITDRGRRISTRLSIKIVFGLLIIAALGILAYGVVRETKTNNNLLILQEQFTNAKEDTGSDFPIQSENIIQPSEVQPGILKVKVVLPNGQIPVKPKLLIRGYFEDPNSFFYKTVETKPDENGFVSISNLTPALYWVALEQSRNPRWFLAKFIDLRKAKGGNILLSKADLLPNLNVLVLDPDGKPYPNAKVDVKYALARPENGRVNILIPVGIFASQNDGVVKIPQLSIGTYFFSASCDEWVISGDRFNLTPETAKEQIILRLKRTKPISGKVIGMNGEPVIGCQVVAPVTYKENKQYGHMGNYVGKENIPSWARRITDNQGDFEFKTLPEDSAYGFYAWHSELGIGYIENISPGDTNVIIQIHPGRNIKGRILDPETRKPLSVSTITTRGISKEWPWWVGFSITKTDRQGNFEFRNISPAVRTLELHKGEWGGSPKNTYTFNLPSREVENMGDIILGEDWRDYGFVVDDNAWESILTQLSNSNAVFPALNKIQSMGRDALPWLINSALDTRPAKYAPRRSASWDYFKPGTYYTRLDGKECNWVCAVVTSPSWTLGDECLSIACDLVEFPITYGASEPETATPKWHKAFRNYTYHALKDWYEKHKNDKTPVLIMNADEKESIRDNWRNIEKEISNETAALPNTDEIFNAVKTGDAEKVKTLLVKIQNRTLVNA